MGDIKTRYELISSATPYRAMEIQTINREPQLTEAQEKLAEEIRALLSMDTTHMTGYPIGVPCTVDYNAESQRFEIIFQSKPKEYIRLVLKGMGIEWNRFLGGWTLYTWQARLFEKDQLARFLSALNRGIIVDTPQCNDTTKRPWWKEIKDKVSEIIDALAEETDAERYSETFRQCVKYVHGFHNYSWKNRFLINMQCEDASFVAGERKWNEIGRFVKWGERPIWILGPRYKSIIELDPLTRDKVERKELVGFLSLPVYDISQTDGEQTPLERAVDIKGDDAQPFLEAMKSFCKQHKIQVDFRSFSSGCYGISYGGRIEVTDSHSANKQFSTLVHEVAHEYLHRTKVSRRLPDEIKEVQAEGVAYAVCTFFDLPSKSPVYISLRGANGSLVAKCGQTICKTSHLLITHVLESLIGLS